MADYTNRFSGKAEDYNKYRPKYPEELKTLLVEKLGLTPEKLIADIGSGTGISSEIFLDNGNMVFAVEPNEEMRIMAEQTMDLEENFVSVDGTAENTGLNNKSIDLIFSGTAFHWFDIEKTKKEFHRILKDNGNIVIAWNNRDLEDDFQKSIESVFNKYLPKLEKVEEQKFGKGIEEFFAPQKPHYELLKYSQNFSFEDLLGRLRSSSYFPEEGSEVYLKIVEEVYQIFNEFQKDERINFNYKTQVFWV